MPLSSLPLDPHEPGGAIQPNLPQRTPGCEKCGLTAPSPEIALTGAGVRAHDRRLATGAGTAAQGSFSSGGRWGPGLQPAQRPTDRNSSGKRTDGFEVSYCGQRTFAPGECRRSIAALAENEFLVAASGDLVGRPPEIHAVTVIAQDAARGSALDVAVHAGLPEIDLRGEQFLGRLDDGPGPIVHLAPAWFLHACSDASA